MKRCRYTVKLVTPKHREFVIVGNWPAGHTADLVGELLGFKPEHVANKYLRHARERGHVRIGAEMGLGLNACRLLIIANAEERGL